MHVCKPNRVTRTYTQHLIGTPAQVMPLLCPVREADWIEDWNPSAVMSHTGLVEPDCVFVTPGSPHESIWYVIRCEPHMDFVEMIKITPQLTACRLAIQLQATSAGCDATVTYAHTSLGPQGDAFVESFTDTYYAQFMRDWESRINHYLSTGTLLRSVA